MSRLLPRPRKDSSPESPVSAADPPLEDEVGEFREEFDRNGDGPVLDGSSGPDRSSGSLASNPRRSDATPRRDIEEFLKAYLFESEPLANYHNTVASFEYRRASFEPGQMEVENEVIGQVNTGMLTGFERILVERVKDTIEREFQSEAYRDAVERVDAVLRQAGLGAHFKDELQTIQNHLVGEIHNINTVLAGEAVRNLKVVKKPKERPVQQSLTEIGDMPDGSPEEVDAKKARLMAYFSEHYPPALEKAFDHIRSEGPRRVAQRFADYLLRIFGVYAKDHRIVADAVDKILEDLRLTRTFQESVAERFSREITASLALRPHSGNVTSAQQLEEVRAIQAQLSVIGDSIVKLENQKDRSSTSIPTRSRANAEDSEQGTE